ncbi:MAG: hypothetical protein LBP70_00825 [Mycoplasmataceae bacterium]|nr:hypothetical protein [Mycoplasmataceae bacterium]
MMNITRNKTLNDTLEFSPVSYFQKAKYQKQWVKFCHKHEIKDTTLKISDWALNPTAYGFYNEKLGVKLRFAIPRFVLLLVPIIGWIIFLILAGTKGILSFVKMKTGELVKVEK